MSPVLRVLTLSLVQNTGEAKCKDPSLSWRQDGHIYGGTGSALINGQGDRGCNTRVSTAHHHTAAAGAAPTAGRQPGRRSSPPAGRWPIVACSRGLPA